MSGSKANRLRGEWTDTKIEMVRWLRKSLIDLPEAKKASDIKDMIEATKKISDMVGKDRPEDDEEHKLENADVTKASEEIRRAIKRHKDVTADIFGSGDDDDED